MRNMDLWERSPRKFDGNPWETSYEFRVYYVLLLSLVFISIEYKFRVSLTGGYLLPYMYMRSTVTEYMLVLSSL